MMPTEVYLELLRKSLQDQKTRYDYLQLTLPIISGLVIAIFGWVSSYILNKRTLNFQLKKEQYYGSKDSMNKIVELNSEYIHYIYLFVKEMKNNFNRNIKLDDDMLNDFITEYQIKLARIHQKIRIEFPIAETRTAKIRDEMNAIESVYRGLQEIQQNTKEPESVVKNKTLQLHSLASKTVENILNYLSEEEVLMIKSLKEEAIKLKIAKKKKT